MLVTSIAQENMLKKKNKTKQQQQQQQKKQEWCHFTTAGESFEKIYILQTYHICVHHEDRICKNRSVLFYLTKQYFYELIGCYKMHYNNYFVEHIRRHMRWGGGGVADHVNIE